jgi:hypothetical protein
MKSKFKALNPTDRFVRLVVSPAAVLNFIPIKVFSLKMMGVIGMKTKRDDWTMSSKKTKAFHTEINKKV